MQKFLIIPSDLKGGPAQYQTEAIAADFMLFKYSCACLRGVAEIITFALPTVFPDARTVCTGLEVIFLQVHKLVCLVLSYFSSGAQPKFWVYS